MRAKRWSWLLLCCLAPAWAQSQVYALVGKSTSDLNFIRAWQGCDAAARAHGDRCLHVGAPGQAQVRRQDAALMAALAQPLAGVALSVMHSGLLAQGALRRAADLGVPVITFDSDLAPGEQLLRRGYVGPDNQLLGQQLGQAVRAVHPQGGTVCVLTDARDPNLRQRLSGLRRALSGQPDWPDLQRLQGQGGWREPDRCPWQSGDSTQRALQQMSLSLVDMAVDVFVSVGHWPVLNVPLFRAAVAPQRDALLKRRQSIFVAVGQPNQDQLALLHEGWVRGYATIDFWAMGEAAYQQMKRVAQGRTIESFTPTPTALLQAP